MSAVARADAPAGSRPQGLEVRDGDLHGIVLRRRLAKTWGTESGLWAR